MIKKIFELFSGIAMTAVAGVFLAASLIMMLIKASFLINPAWVTVILCGYPLLYLAVTRILTNKGMSKISSALLISIAMVASIAIGELFAAGEVAFIMALGGILEDKTVARAKKGIKQLISLAPENGRKIIDGKEETISIEKVREGDILRVLPGEAIPVDGEILSGHTSVDQSIITGESLPVDKTIGDSVFCGTINCFGSIDIRATKVGNDSSLQKLIRMVQDAENNKAPMQRIVDKWAAWLVPIAFLIAVSVYFITFDIIRAVTILVVFCPCALALATPTSVMAAIGQATKHGIIIKSGDALERMGKVNCVAFDKTGTLTHGNLIVSDIKTFDETLSQYELLAAAASVEAHSEHPLGKAIVSYAKNKNVPVKVIENFKMIPGKGIRANIDGSSIYCGSSTWLTESGITLNDNAAASLEQFRKEGKATILVANEKELLGIISLTDTLRSSARDMVKELNDMQTDTVLLTGDNRQTADYFAAQVGILNIYAELLPEKKVEKIQQLQSTGFNICMIGDGVNDAPALKTANIGIAMGSMGSDIAIEAADVALMGDDISKIPYLKRLSNAVLKLIAFNITLSMAINLVAVILSALAVLNPVTGALVHNVGSVLVVLNAALLYDRKYT